MIRIAILGCQILTFGALGVVFVLNGQWRLGVAQGLLALVQGVVYSGSMT